MGTHFEVYMKIILPWSQVLLKETGPVKFTKANIWFQYVIKCENKNTDLHLKLKKKFKIKSLIKIGDHFNETSCICFFYFISNNDNDCP